MTFIFAVLFGFVLGIGALLFHAALGRGSAQNPLKNHLGALLALYPAGVFALLLSRSGEILGSGVAERLEWASELGLSLSFRLDGLSLLFGLLVSGIGALVLIYASGYLGAKNYAGRFYFFLVCFMAAMLGLVFSDNLLCLFVFWELTSITSYGLIGTNHESKEARASALKALLVTGGGGLVLLAGVLLLGIAGGSFELSTLLNQGDALKNHPYYAAILACVAIGCFTKSAQFPFHFWLPDAMAAPTPVSAYLHSATMVKAGIFLLARLFPALGGTPAWTWTLSIFGATTLLVGGFLAVFQTDLKRVLAYSTVSALGALTLLLGLGSSKALAAFSVFLVAHALYKGALFMLAGAVDHETGTRDAEKLSGLRAAMPKTAVIAGLAALCLAGAGPLFSFIGKEMLFEAVLGSGNAILIVAAVFSGALFVAVAAIVGFKPFWGAQTPHDLPKTPHEAPSAMLLGPAILAVLGLILGIFPQLVGKSLISPATSAILGEAYTAKIVLWHGFNTALLMSVVSLAAGAGIYAMWANLRRVHALGAARWGWLGLGPARGYDGFLVGLNWSAKTTTRLLQNGSLPFYMRSVILCAVVSCGGVLLWQSNFAELFGSVTGPPKRMHEVVLALLLGAAAFVMLRAPSRLAALAALGVIGYGISLLFLFFGAPDLAMTQVLVDTLAVILFVLVFHHLPHFKRLSSTRTRVVDAIFAISGGAMLTALILATNHLQWHEPISWYFGENSVPGGHGRNVVNVILVDFRALDTLGEITALALAALGVYSLLRLRAPQPEIIEARPQSAEKSLTQEEKHG